jgi:hypothetical protein
LVAKVLELIGQVLFEQVELVVLIALVERESVWVDELVGMVEKIVMVELPVMGQQVLVGDPLVQIEVDLVEVHLALVDLASVEELDLVGHQKAQRKNCRVHRDSQPARMLDSLVAYPYDEGNLVPQN